MKNRAGRFAIETPKLRAGSPPRRSDYDADIIILMKERIAETVEAVNSALRQQNCTFHVSVLDQGSSPAVQAEFSKMFEAQENFAYYVAARNLGVGGGRNFLSAAGLGTCIIGLDNDAVFADDLVVANAVALFAATPALGVIGFRILARDGINLDTFSWGYPQALKAVAQENFSTTTFVGAGHAIRRETWIAAGGYDADLFFTWEEYDFSLRAIALQWSILYAGKLAVIHKVAPEARVAWQSDRMRLFVRNRLVIARKWNIPWLQLSPRILGYLLRAARNGGLRPACAGLIETVQLDRRLFKKPLTLHMRQYLHENETRFHRNLIGNFYRHAILATQADPEQSSGA